MPKPWMKTLTSENKNWQSDSQSVSFDPPPPRHCLLTVWLQHLSRDPDGEREVFGDDRSQRFLRQGPYQNKNTIQTQFFLGDSKWHPESTSLVCLPCIWPATNPGYSPPLTAARMCTGTIKKKGGTLDAFIQTNRVRALSCWDRPSCRSRWWRRAGTEMKTTALMTRLHYKKINK